MLRKLSAVVEERRARKLTKAEETEEKEAFRKFWLVAKGLPHNKILKRIKENPELRAEIENGKPTTMANRIKKRSTEALSELYIIVDERANEYELTDKGIHAG